MIEVLPLSLLLIYFSTTPTHACIPMQPPENLPCPAAPKPTMLPPNTITDEYSHMIGPSKINGEDVYKCDAIMVSGATGKDLPATTTIVCQRNTGYWIIRDSVQKTDTPVGAATYYCKETFDCSKCNTLVKGMYDGSPPADGTYAMTVVETRVQKSCTFTCDKKIGYDLINQNGDIAFDSVTCDATATTAEAWFMPGADQFAQWICAKCACTVGIAAVACPAGLACVAPTVTDPVNAPCIYNCPEGTTTYFTDTDGNLQSSKQKDLKCKGGIFRALDDYREGLHCRKAGPPGEEDVPTGSKCTAIPNNPAPYIPPMETIPVEPIPGQIRYSMVDGKLVFNCAMGTLYYESTPYSVVPGGVTFLTCDNGKWTDGVTRGNTASAATCLPDKIAVQECLDVLWYPAVVEAGLVLYECMNGRCRMYCKEPTQFMYEIKGKVVKTGAEAYCEAGMFTSPEDFEQAANCA